MREHFNGHGLAMWLDTWAGRAVTGQHGYSRHRAAEALAEYERNDMAWRRSKAEDKFLKYPERYESPTHALRDVADPPSGGVWLGDGKTTSTADIARLLSGGDPRFRWIVGPEETDATAKVGTRIQGGHVVDDPALTQSPWQRG